jgi:hypothetical protein
MDAPNKQVGIVKDKDRIRLVEILNIMAGKQGEVFARSGKDEHAGRYMTFQCEGRTLDCEFPTPEAATFVFKKFAELFQAYATAQTEKLKGEAVTIRVAAIVDGGASSAPQLKPAPVQQQPAAHSVPHTPGSFRASGALQPPPPPPAYPYQLASPAPSGYRGAAGYVARM